MNIINPEYNPPLRKELEDKGIVGYLTTSNNNHTVEYMMAKLDMATKKGFSVMIGTSPSSPYWDALQFSFIQIGKIIKVLVLLNSDNYYKVNNRSLVSLAQPLSFRYSVNKFHNRIMFTIVSE